MLKNVPLFGVGNKGRSPNVNAQKRVNLYVEMQQDPEANGIVLYPTPGLSTFVNFGASPSRGAYGKDNLLYVVNGATLWEVAGDGTTTSRGTLSTSGGRVDIADNGIQMLIVDGTATGYLYTFATFTLTTVTLPFATDTCTFMDGRFVIQKHTLGQFGWSPPYDGTTFDALSFATAESDPDNLVRVMADSGILLLFGDRTTEFWGDSGAADQPFSRIGASAIEWGLAARWSLCKFDGSLMFLRRNKLGAVQVCALTGNQATPISTPELDYILSTYAAVDNATAFAYIVAGHAMYQINFPTPGESWEYDGLSKEWHRKQYGASGRHRGEIQANFLNRPFVTDYDNGKVYLLDQNAYTDDGQYIVREFVSRHNKSGDFLTISQLWLEMESGVGLVSGQGSDPKVMMQVSRTGGKRWGAERTVSFGKFGEDNVRAIWNQLGRARDWVFKFRITDPVKTVFVAAWARVGS